MSLSPFPSFAYTIPFPGAKIQAVHGAERPGACMIAAYASHLRGERILGAGRHLTPLQIGQVFATAASTIGIPIIRLQTWAEGINCDRFEVTPGPIGGLTPSQYQLGAVAGLTVAGGVLAMGIGLGKTLTTAVAARSYVVDQWVAPTRCWIVAPLSAMAAWTPFLPDLRRLYADVKVISIDSAHKLVGADNSAGGLLVIDEAHYAGHHDARRTRALHKIRLGFDACICLTGTLLHSGIEAAMNVLDLAIPGCVGFSTKWTAGEYFQCLERFELSSGRRVAKVGKPVGNHRDAFLTWCQRYVVALAKDSPAVRNEITIPEQHLHTVTFGDDLDSEDAAVECLVRLVHEHYLDKGLPLPHASELRHVALRDGVAMKMEWLLEQMADNDLPVAVFAEYQDTLDAAELVLTEAKISYARVDGAVTGEARAEIVRRFQAGEIRVFLGQIDATGLSINLFRASISVAIDHTQRAANYAQMLGRTCRRGQTEECNHIDLVANPVQAVCVSRLRAGEDFNAALTTLCNQALTKDTSCIPSSAT